MIVFLYRNYLTKGFNFYIRLTRPSGLALTFAIAQKDAEGTQANYDCA